MDYRAMLVENTQRKGQLEKQNGRAKSLELLVKDLKLQAKELKEEIGDLESDYESMRKGGGQLETDT